MSAHTPTPWRSETLPTSCGRLFRIGDNRMLAATKALGERKIGPVIVYDDYPNGPDTEQSANVELIVRAVNAHDALVLAAREAAVVIADVLAASGQSGLSSPVLVHLLNALDVADGKQREPLVPLGTASK